MARFRGSVKGSRSETSRLGSPRSGLTVEANGWESGVRVETWYNPEKGVDLHDVYLTTGSSPKGKKVYLGTIVEGEDGPEWIQVI